MDKIKDFCCGVLKPLRLLILLTFLLAFQFSKGKKLSVLGTIIDTTLHTPVSLATIIASR